MTPNMPGRPRSDPRWPHLPLDTDRLTRLEVVMWGVDGSNGLRSDVRGLKSDLAALIAWRDRLLLSLRWAMILLIVLVGAFGSDATVDRLLSIAKELRGWGG